jgi:hypothetical protein
MLPFLKLLKLLLQLPLHLCFLLEELLLNFLILLSKSLALSLLGLNSSDRPGSTFGVFCPLREGYSLIDACGNSFGLYLS